MECFNQHWDEKPAIRAFGSRSFSRTVRNVALEFWTIELGTPSESNSKARRQVEFVTQLCGQ